MTNKGKTSIQISIKTRERLMTFDKYMTKENPTHEDRIIWLMDNHLGYF